ncbi:glycosyltransferase family 2 protein [Acinetobacter pseudolwoffii]|uniref:glycosyltransferase family 2 protein n=1 Tax=Acinetobacter pseudolwoffii TaxID=2053287 RepID=UPI000943ABC9|nr:glycosyltransferase family 2 protein [Acinetobacter pseudolwoffii]
MVNIIKVSILMPVYNEDKYILDAVNSILSYDYNGLDIELIVVDDQSTDRTYDILSDLRNSNENIFLFKNKNKGKNNALNMAYEHSTGQYICMMGGDDLFEPKTLELRVRKIHEVQLKGVDSVYSCCKIKTFSLNKKYDSILIPKDNEKGSSSGGAIAFTKTLGNKIFPIPNNLPNEDSWIAHYFEFFSVTRVDIPDIGLYYRIHDNNSHKRGLSFEKFKEQMWLRSKSIILFYNVFHTHLSREQERKLVERINLESSIYLQNYISIIFSRNLSLRKKIISLTYSSKIFYYIKDRFYKYLAGK